MKEQSSSSESPPEVHSDETQGKDTSNVVHTGSGEHENPSAPLATSIKWADQSSTPSDGKALRIPSPQDQEKGMLLIRRIVVCTTSAEYSVLGRTLEEVDMPLSDDGNFSECHCISRECL